MLKNVADITTQKKQTGLNTQDNILGIDNSQSPDMMDVRVYFDGSLEKRLGSNTQNSVIITNSAASGFNPVGTLTVGLISFWPLNEASGTRFDVIGSNNLSDNNGVLSSGGIRGKAASFVLSNSQFLLKETLPQLETGDINFSISTWVYLTSTSTTVERAIVSKRDTSIGNDVVLLLHCDGVDGSTTFTDNSLSAHTVTANGNAQIDTAQFKFGTASGLFDGTGDFLSIPDSVDWDFGTGDWTIDLWFRLPATGGIYRLFGSQAGETDWMWADIQTNADNRASITIMGNLINFTGLNAVTDTWTHLEFVRSGTNVFCFKDGVQLGSTGTNSDNITSAGAINFGRRNDASSEFNGWLDEIRVLKGTASNITNFTPQTAAYSNPSTARNYEYYLFINTDNIVTFRVSSSGTSHDGQITASSFGALNTATWYNVVAYHDTADLLAVGVNLSMNSGAYASGVRVGSAPFVLGAVSNGVLACFDGRIDETGFWKSILGTADRSALYNSGSGNTFQTSFEPTPWASFDFGASSIRWLMVSAGTGVYASSNLGVSWVTVATDRSATYQYFERSKNALIATSDLFDTPLAWTGSANTFMTVVNSNAPLCKYSINFNGFLIMLNSNTRKRGFFYQDENTQLTGTWASSFDIPSSQDDEITATFILRRYLYVSTRYYLYRVSYVGGNPDFSYLKVKDWGYVQRTVRQLYVEGVGQVVAGLCWDGKMRLFDGSDEQIFSDNVERYNGLCDFALDNLSFSGSGPVVSFAETDYNENVYKICLAIGAQSNQTTHMLNYDGRAKSFYPYARQHFNTMVMAESGNKRYMMAFDRSGYVHMLDSGNLDGNTTPINEHYDSSFIYEKSPAQIQKGHETHLFFSNDSCGRICVLDRKDYDKDYKDRDSFSITGSDNKNLIHKVIDVPETYNVYQWRITSSANTMSPWKLQRYDHMLKGLGIGKND